MNDPMRQTTAMVEPISQKLQSVFDATRAIQNGTLFPELCKPMRTQRMEMDASRPSPKQAGSFAAWEMRLFLNTHPQDEQALHLYHKYCQMTEKPNYACTFVPESAHSWAWLDDPWPWELEACEAEVPCHVCV